MRTSGRRFFSPPCEGGVRGGGPDRTSASSVYSPFVRNDVGKRLAIKTGEAAHVLSTSSIDLAKHASLLHRTLTGPPPLAPPSQGGEKSQHLVMSRGIRPTAPGPPFTRGGKSRTW